MGLEISRCLRDDVGATPRWFGIPSKRLESLLILTQSDQGKSHYLQKSVAKHVVFLFDKNRIIGSKYIIFNEKGNFIKLSFIKFPVIQADSTSVPVYVKIGVQCNGVG